MNEKLSNEDVDVINKSGFLTAKSELIELKIKKLVKELRGK